MMGAWAEKPTEIGVLLYNLYIVMGLGEQVHATKQVLDKQARGQHGGWYLINTGQFRSHMSIINVGRHPVRSRVWRACGYGEKDYSWEEKFTRYGL
jgi:hypothetical protein